ncbi:MAG: NADH-quinone oxidoreductase subunit C [Bellilinea sp.]
MASTIGSLGAAEAVLKPFATTITRPQPERLEVNIHPDNLLAAVRALVDESWGYLSAIVGLDRPAQLAAEGMSQPESAIDVLYLFCSGAAVVTLRITLSYSQAVIPTISGIAPTAMLYEWELREMFGVEVVGLRVTGHLILADDWPAGVYPLRKSFTGFNQPIVGAEGA